VRRDALDLFAESVTLHEPLLPVLSAEDPLALMMEGGVPRLEELRLHQGTVWRWNRAIYDPDAGGHLRIEFRALPAGPGIADMIANAAYLVGLTLGLAPEEEAWTASLDFEKARNNFYRAARQGLEAALSWPAGPGGRVETVKARDLATRLLPIARQGLLSGGVDSAEADALIDVIAERIATGRTGAAWQKRVLADLESRSNRDEALAGMLERYLACSEGPAPVHRWPDRP
jgi:gamma-glutamylcysteine synthetase